MEKGLYMTFLVSKNGKKMSTHAQHTCSRLLCSASGNGPDMLSLFDT